MEAAGEGPDRRARDPGVEVGVTRHRAADGFGQALGRGALEHVAGDPLPQQGEHGRLVHPAREDHDARLGPDRTDQLHGGHPAAGHPQVEEGDVRLEAIDGLQRAVGVGRRAHDHEPLLVEGPAEVGDDVRLVVGHHHGDRSPLQSVHAQPASGAPPDHGEWPIAIAQPDHCTSRTRRVGEKPRSEQRGLWSIDAPEGVVVHLHARDAALGG